jgi:WhiB family redox-sensing transcriptional regulator
MHEPTWVDQAACKGAPIEYFFAVTPDRYGVERHDPVLLAEGRRICDRCPVREECLDAALAKGLDVHGVWGGTTKAERERLLRHIRRAKCPVCASASLRAEDFSQVCLDCGQSWTIVRPSAQTRPAADTAA